LNFVILRTIVAVVSVASFFSSAVVGAQTYPIKPITLIVGYPPGGSVDLVARTIAPELGRRLGQPVVIENAAGASGTIGTQKVVSATPDGYTLLLGSGSEISIARLTNAAVRYDGARDLSPLVLIGTQPMVLVGKAAIEAKNTDELVAAARRAPGKYSYASSGTGTPLHLAGEMINQQGKIELLHVPYKGAAPMANDILGGQIDLAVFVLSSALPHIKSGKVRAFGITEAKRSKVAPEIAALSETKGLEGVDMGVWFGLFAPAKLPAPIAERLQTELLATLADASIRAKLFDAGVNVLASPAPELTAFIQRETQKYRKIVEVAKIKE
jgi:tripartite-type tricarboxylate transporter receptor subunit TctC